MLVCHVMLHDNAIKGSCNFMGGAYQNSNHPAKFGGHRHCGSRDVFSLPHDLARLRNQGVI